jgi:hypothetical protein
MWFELKNKLQNILINIIYRSERQSHDRVWDFFDDMLKNAMEESNHLICMGDLNKKKLNLPSNINDLISINGHFNAIHQPTHFDSRTGSFSLLDPILITDSIQYVDSDTMHIDRSIMQFSTYHQRSPKHDDDTVSQICKLYLLNYFVAWFLIRTTYIQQVGSLNLHVF